MSEPYVVRSDGSRPSDGESTAPQVLAVEQGGELVFKTMSSLTGSAAVSFRDIPVADLDRVIRQAALQDLEAGLVAGIYPPADTTRYTALNFDTHSGGILRATLEREKECLWQDRAERGWECAASADSERLTTRAICSGCVIPDRRAICIHLVHARTSFTGRERVATAECDIGEDAEDGRECRIGGKPCARRLVAVERAVSAPPADVARRASDEIDYFSLVYRDRYGAKVWSIPQARTISELFGECGGAEDFQRRVASLADLLSQLAPHAQLGAGMDVNSEGQKVGSLVALERLMQRDYPEAVPAVQTLRRIADARNAFPVHTRSEKLLSTLRSLGVSFPATDWDLAWRQVLTAFWEAIRDIRSSLQSASRNSDIGATP